MLVLLFPFFLANLLLKICWSITLMSWTVFRTWIPFLTSVTVAAIIIGTNIIGSSFFKQLPIQARLPLENLENSIGQNHFNQGMSKKALDQEIHYWETLLPQQPTDRDILVNLSELYKAEGNLQKSASYLDAAKKVDPNYKF